MSKLGKFIANDTPKYNKVVAEGICYHKLKHALKWIDEVIRFAATEKTDTRLVYLGYRVLTPEEAAYVKFKTGNTTNPYEMAENTTYPVEYSFCYNGGEIRNELIYIPYMEKGNTMTMSGKEKTIAPFLTNKVISIGERTIFISIMTSKQNFNRFSYTLRENGYIRQVPIITADIYKKPTKKYAVTTKAKTTIMLYLLAVYGYSKTMEMLLGFVPTPVYDAVDDPDKVVYSSNGIPPKGWNTVKDNKNKVYVPNNIKFVVDRDKVTPELPYYLGNVLYILDNFPGRSSVDSLDDKRIWVMNLGEIILTGGHGLAYRNTFMDIHLKGECKDFDFVTKCKLKDIGCEANHLIELLVVILKNFNTWISNGDSSSLYHGKSLEVEQYLLSPISQAFVKLYFDVNKDESRIGNKPLEQKDITSLLKRHIRMNKINELRKEKTHVFAVEDTTDSLYYKKTAFVALQENDSTNVAGGGTNTSTRYKLSASMATFGCFLSLSKKNPNPCIRQNPMVTIDPITGTILPDPVVGDIVERTEKLLANTYIYRNVKDASEEDDLDVDTDDGDSFEGYEETEEDNFDD